MRRNWVLACVLAAGCVGQATSLGSPPDGFATLDAGAPDSGAQGDAGQVDSGAVGDAGGDGGALGIDAGAPIDGGRADAGGGSGTTDGGSTGGSYFIDFTTTPAQDPLTAGGVWTNNTQGTGGNVAMNVQSSMRVIAAASGGINMAGGDANGQDAPFDYLDSFAFVPGFTGNQRVTTVMYVDPGGYTPAANHELELLLGCSSASGSRKWISNTWNRGGARIMALMDGPANGFTILNPTDNGGFGGDLADGDVWVAELNRSTNTVITKRNGVQVQSLTDGRFAGHGSGMGIGSFRRTNAGGSAPNRYGFRSVRFETF